MKKTFSLSSLTKQQKKLRRSILDISFRSGYSHLGSCLSAVDLIDAVYEAKKKKDEFVLSNGHAAVAWYVVLAERKMLAHEKIEDLSIHPDRDLENNISVSTGSLGQGLPIAVGMALADRSRFVYCLISDGECREGSIWEGLRIAFENNLNNFVCIINANGWAAYHAVSAIDLKKQLRALGYAVVAVDGHDSQSLKKEMKNVRKNGRPTIIFANTTVEQLNFLRGQSAHYHVMNEKEHQLAMEALK